MFGVGFSELAMIAFVAVVVMGPDRLPDLARQAGRFLRTIKVMANNARDEIRSELGPEYSDLELRDLDPRRVVRKHVLEAMHDAELEAAAEERRERRRPALPDGEVPPFDAEAT